MVHTQRLFNRTQIKLAVPSCGEQVGQFPGRIKFTIEQGSHNYYSPRLKSLAADNPTNFSHFHFIRQGFPFLFALESRGIVFGFFPLDDMVVLPQLTSESKVTMPRLLFAEYDVHTTGFQQSNISVPVIQAISKHNITGLQCSPHLSKQALFSGILATTRTYRTFQDGPNSQRQQHGKTQDRKSETWLLILTLWVFLLVFRRVSHRGRRAIDNLHGTIFPQPF